MHLIKIIKYRIKEQKYTKIEGKKIMKRKILAINIVMVHILKFNTHIKTQMYFIRSYVMFIVYG